MTIEDQQKALAEALGWTGVHGGPSEGGMFLRGHPPSDPTGRRLCEEVPDLDRLKAMLEALPRTPIEPNLKIV